MGILRVDHPDIMEFIKAKEQEGFLTNFNTSIAITDTFMEALEKVKEYNLINPRNHQVVKHLPAQEIFEQIILTAWKVGDPGIIFIDIALAQIAALGTMIGLLLGFAEDSGGLYWISLIFTLVIISVFALTKFEKQIIPQEAIIGIIYGLGLGLAMLLAEKIPGGSNFITKTITGNILWVTWEEVLSSFILFALIAFIHLFFR